MQNHSTFFDVAMVFAAIANLCYFVAVTKLIRIGVRVKFLAMPKDALRVLRQYQSMAQENDWPLWPLYGFWVCAIPFAVSAITFFVLHAIYPSTSFSLREFPSRKLVLIWVMATSLLEAFLFSYRIRRYTSDQRIEITDWRRWVGDEYTRNDFYLAIVGWMAFLVSSLVLIAGRVWRH